MYRIPLVGIKCILYNHYNFNYTSFKSLYFYRRIVVKM